MLSTDDIIFNKLKAYNKEYQNNLIILKSNRKLNVLQKIVSKFKFHKSLKISFTKNIFGINNYEENLIYKQVPNQ